MLEASQVVQSVRRKNYQITGIQRYDTITTKYQVIENLNSNDEPRQLCGYQMQDDASFNSVDGSKAVEEATKTPLRSSTRQRKSAKSQIEASACVSQNNSPSVKELREREKAERERIRQEKRERVEREKEARRLQREAERKAREREKEEERRAREREKEEERARREEEKRAREREKEEERARKDEERKAREREREEERARKEEERKAKEEERKKREFEKLREEEERQRKLEKQRAFMKSFVILNKSTEISDENSKTCDPNSRFMKFQLKKDQKLAPLCRIDSESLLKKKRQNIEDLVLSWRDEEQSAIDGSKLGLTLFGRPNYLLELRKGQIEPMSYPPTWPLEPPEGLGVLIQDMSNQPFNYGDSGNGGVVWVRTKYLYFDGNVRPPYYGTYRSRSAAVGPRRPFAKDVQRLNYDYDSDDEWEEVEGESLTHSDQEDDDDSDDSDEDGKFVVPHGYLSDDEREGAEGGPEPTDEPCQMKRLRQQLAMVEHEALYNRGNRKLRPLLIGPIWSRNPLSEITKREEETAEQVAISTQKAYYDTVVGEDKENDKTTANVIEEDEEEKRVILTEKELAFNQEVLGNFAVYLWPKVSVPVSILIKPVQGQMVERAKKRFPPSALPYLIRLMHKNQLSKVKLQFEFRAFWLSHTWSGEGKPPLERFRHFHDVDDSADTEDKPQPSSKMLPISKASVLRKITEIGIFEEGVWRVRPEVLEANRDAILSLKGLPPIDNSVDPTCSTFEFPPWPKSMISSPAVPTVLLESMKNHPEEQSVVETTLVTKKRSTLTDFFATPPPKRPRTEQMASPRDVYVCVGRLTSRYFRISCLNYYLGNVLDV
nr:chromatin assembly factor 1 subunit A B [Hymenolepis microstoma]